MLFDYVVIGAGLSGSTFAERVATVLEKNVLVIERRAQVAGNCYDSPDAGGIRVHRYGPHIFHTASAEVWRYLGQFTEWIPYQHRVHALVDGRIVPLPANLDTLRMLLPPTVAARTEERLLGRWGYDAAVPILELRGSDDPDLRSVAELLYGKIFLGYTRKQWGMEPEQLDAAVSARVPVRLSRDDRYFRDPYQGLPRDGYTAMVQRMLANPRIKLLLNTDYREVLGIEADGDRISLLGREITGGLVVSSMIDEFFGYRHGELPYRSLRFEERTERRSASPGAATTNYPNDYDFTRITDYGRFPSPPGDFTTTVREYPEQYRKGEAPRMVPCYPVPTSDNRHRYERYAQEAQAHPRLLFLGRLGRYSYCNMDEAVLDALRSFEACSGRIA